jgi:organic radical activating enzyme
MTDKNDNNWYCSQKFTWLSVDVEKRLSYSCCAATPNKINIEWLKSNQGRLFATPELLKERQDMLNNIPVSSCETACWVPENQGLVSRRIAMKSNNFADFEVNVTNPESLNIVLGSTCNLTCSYCCKQYSSAWSRDLDSNNEYPTYENRYQLIPADRIVLQISHDENQESDAFKTIMAEIGNLKNSKEIIISGGEPLLYNDFPDLLNQLADANHVRFYTGLGVNTKRLQKQLEKIHARNNLEITVSAENCEEFYEFNRYGNTYKNFLTNLELLIQEGFAVKFSSVISNLTVFGLEDFFTRFGNFPIHYLFCNDPDFLSVNVLDDASKSKLIQSLTASGLPGTKEIITNLQQPCSLQQKNQLAQFIKTFSKRRNLSLDIFPSSMLKWLGI